MKPLPSLLRKLPALFYVLAVVFFAWQTVNQWMSVSLVNGDMGELTSNSFNSFDNLSKSMALYQASLEAAYMVANGALIQVLIAIYDKLGATRA